MVNHVKKQLLSMTLPLSRDPRSLLFIIALLLVIFSAVFSGAAENKGNLLLTIPPILAANSSSPVEVPPGGTLSLRLYVAGESIEELNHFNNLPFNKEGVLNNRDSENNTRYEYGWMVPFTERLKLLDSQLSVEWVGSSCWVDHDTYECSNGTYTNERIGHTSAVSGSTVENWLADNGTELINKEFCYDVAFASRGGNDLNNGVPISTYKDQLRQLIMLLDQGSSCRTHPVIYVTAHLLDVAGWNYGYLQTDIDNWMAAQKEYYVTVAQELVAELNNQNGMIVRFIDMWTPFREDIATTAFPSETWWKVDQDTGVNMPDLDKIHRDEQHPKRLASIFAGENVANQINRTELRQLLKQ